MMQKTASVLLSLILAIVLTGTTGFHNSISASTYNLSQTNTSEQINPFATLDDVRKADMTRMVQKYTDTDHSLTAKDNGNSADQSDSASEKGFNVQFKSSVSFSEIYSLISSYTYQIIGSSSMKTFHIQTDSEDTLKTKLQGKYVYFEQDTILQEMETPNDPSFSSQWALTATNLPAAWDMAKGSANVTVAMIDSGVNRSNEDLAKATILNGKDYLRPGYGVVLDTKGHGTSTTGIIAAVTNNGLGISGVCWNVTILPMLVLNSDGKASQSNVAAAIYDSADAGADIINLSLGSSTGSDTEKNAVAYAISKGCIVVAAAGNDGNSIYNYPASFDGVISVGSIDSNMIYSSFSTYNDKVDVSAPGGNVLSTADKTIDNVDYKQVSGTSFSSPYVAGIAALARSCNDSINSDDFLKILKLACTDKGDPGYDVHFGYGIIDAKRVVAIAKNLPQNWDFPYSVNGSTAQIMGYIGAGGNVVIPSTLGGYPVTSIGENAFVNCNTITSITIPAGVTSIGSNNFQNCTSLTGVTFLGNVTSIGVKSFINCKSLTAVTFGSNVTNAGPILKDAFDYLLQITVDQSNPVYSGEDGILYNHAKTELVRCPRATSGSYTVPNFVTSIGEYAFNSCTNLSTVILPDTVATIGRGAFRNCTGLTSATLPAGLTQIPDELFLQCGGLTSISIPTGVTQIGSYAFDSCSKLKGVVLPNGLTTIANNAFSSCSSLDSIVLPPSVTSLGNEAFLWGIYTAYIQGNAPALGTKVFVGIGSFGYAATTIYYNSQNTGFTSQWSSYQIVAVDPPPAPSVSLVSKTATSVSFSWVPVSGADGYDIYNSTQKMNSQPVESTSYTVTGLNQSTSYTFTVKAVYMNMESIDNMPVTATTDKGLGDVSGDGKVDLIDVTALSRYVAGWTVEVDETALDVNGNGTVDLVDVTLLSRYVAGWNVILK